MKEQEYIELLNTYSDHMALDKEVILPFFREIKYAIEEYDNKIIIDYTVDLYLARKH